MSKLFKGLKKGLQEALAHEERKIALKSEMVEIPESPKDKTRKLNAETKKAMRDIKENKNLIRYKNVGDFWAGMGLSPNAINF